MNEKRICIVCVIMIFVIMTGYHFEKKSEEEISMEPDVVSSISMNRDQYLKVVANRDRIEDKEEFAKLLVKMCTENSFHTIKFSTDRGYATGIHMQVYLCDNDIEEAKVAMKIDYIQREYNEKYDICNNPEEFELFVDGEVTN
ncbi:hypothetical protein [Lachnoclostridium sp. An118]|uniref:hypothetical protein n=1 Tax=Lachnoclostridium sp. An118 TaxID=1965547 RepID=UPI000B399D19|nr:hypothetical protein [Lachnoclostridium sp. An118]OUQ48533.1 hypothetical protein B5E62_13310 [Lachnoclostridium sp. An118]